MRKYWKPVLAFILYMIVTVLLVINGFHIPFYVNILFGVILGIWWHKIETDYFMSAIKDRADALDDIIDKFSQYHICGYDKDADVYEELICVLTYAEAEKMGSFFIDYHINKQELRRPDTNEPYDWFAAFENDNLILVFTEEYPCGIEPERLKQE